MGHHGPHDFFACRITERVDDPLMRVSSLAAQNQLAIELIELRSPFDQFRNTQWGFAHHHVDRGFIAQVTPSDQGVLDVIVEAVFRIPNARNTSLSVGTV